MARRLGSFYQSFMENLKFFVLPFLMIILIKCSLPQKKQKHHQLEIKRLLIQDYSKLKSTVKSKIFNDVTEKEFQFLFYEGIEESIAFLDTIQLPKHQHEYQQIIQKTLKWQNRQHIKLPSHQINSKTTIEVKVNKGYELFKSFTGKWFGLRDSKFVNHYWLSPWKLKNSSLGVLLIESFQTAFTGDGFGWNYQINYKEASYIIGYVCHFDDTGKIVMKRPHVGIPLTDHSIIWLTKDHVYIESIYQNKASSNSRKYYIISGVYFDRLSINFKIMKFFQEVYFSNLQFGLQVPDQSHQ